jgi:hypothetical protein
MDAWAIARHDLHLTSEEFLDMTPRMLQALCRRDLIAMQRNELLVGILASTVANFGFARPDQPLKPEDFMLHPVQQPAVPPEPLTGERLRSMIHALPKQFVRRIQ